MPRAPDMLSSMSRSGWFFPVSQLLTACGLIELAGYLEGAEADHYRSAAVFLLRTLDEKRCCWDPEKDYLLEKCTSAYHDAEHEFSLIYGDYYFLEGILKLTGSEFFLW